MSGADGHVVWLLDVDGVVNARRPGWGAPPRRGVAYACGRAFDIRWAPALVERILALHRSGRVDIRWCSTWCPEADQIERLLGLPRLGRVWNDQRDGTVAALAKLDAAYEVLAAGHRLVWTDDQEVPDGGTVFDELTAQGRALLIAPKSGRGLQPAHLDAIDAFVGLRPPPGAHRA